MDEMISKFPDAPKMKAQYQQYLKKRQLAVQIVKNAIGEKELMIEVMASGQNIGFRSGTRRSLFTQQNPGLNSVKAVSHQPFDRDTNPASFTHLGFQDYTTATSSNHPVPDERFARMRAAGIDRGMSPLSKDRHLQIHLQHSQHDAQSKHMGRRDSHSLTVNYADNKPQTAPRPQKLSRENQMKFDMQLEAEIKAQSFLTPSAQRFVYTNLQRQINIAGRSNHQP